MSISDLRREYSLGSLRRKDLLPDPIAQFRVWFDAATAAGVLEANAMTLSTVTADGKPSARIVLLKGVDVRGFSFFTNYESRKGHELAANPFAALTFLWKEMERQVRVEGTVTKVSREESEAYFRSRPRNSRLGAWGSNQSEVIANRGVLEKNMAEFQARYPGDDVPLPPNWGGYMVKPEAIEFWQGQRSRLHDRLVYRRQADDSWLLERLAP
ncbi:MAG: Pyridoxamine 5'-phosphate oxidase [Verrucomicrobia bacterium]|jgi:pyridoxamine 5'-phosphate oxidase|nr:Pyridoxamine 5'-phosphate oxidase [Verrucomicrobiota bacterium]